jgi:hypothetical protein
MRVRALGAALCAIAVIAAGCSGGGKDAKVDTNNTTTAATNASTTTTAAPAITTTTTPKPTEVTIRPLFVRGSGQGATGGVGKEIVSREASTDKSLRVDLSEDEVAGIGDQSRAASWNAVTVATLLTGAPLSGRYRFEVSGYIDGPSAGALTTVAVLSLIRGDTLGANITMTGTINPDGTLGPVGGIPQKIEGAAKAGFKTVLIPVGQRNSESEVDGALVDVVDQGKRAGMEVVETRDIYEAYKRFTGKDLPRLATGSDPRLNSTAYDRLKAKADGALATYQQAAGSINALDPSIQHALSAIIEQSQTLAGRATNLERQGLQAGAFNYAWQAAAYANAAAKTGEAIQVLFVQGTDAFLSKIDSSAAIQGQVNALLESLKTFTPKTVSDASGLMFAYANAFDALSASIFATNGINAVVADIRNGADVNNELDALLLPLLFSELAGNVVNFAKDVFDVGRDLGGPTINDSDIDLQSIADFFRKGSDANFASFQTTVVKDLGDAIGISQDQMLGRFANVDLDIALAVNQRNVLGGLTKYIGAGEPNAEYAQLGFAINNYARNALLVEKYYSNGQLDNDLNLVSVRSDAALSSALDLAKGQLSASITSLRKKEIEPTLETAMFESAGLDREGDLSDKFTALSSYWTGFVSARVLSYLGGFPTDGLK